MPQYGFKIGSTSSTTNVESLTTPLPAPKSEYQPYQELVTLESGAVRGVGSPVARWRWGFLTQAQRDQLRTFCAGASATVYITTMTNDSSSAYDDFVGVMIWPEEEERYATRRADFVVEFRQLVAV